jgi:hypothetical protein
MTELGLQGLETSRRIVNVVAFVFCPHLMGAEIHARVHACEKNTPELPLDRVLPRNMARDGVADDPTISLTPLFIHLCSNLLRVNGPETVAENTTT